MTNREKLEKSIECMNNKGGKSADEWNMFLLTEIADLLAIIADKMGGEVENGNDD